jgi:hypothetical protein
MPTKKSASATIPKGGKPIVSKPIGQHPVASAPDAVICVFAGLKYSEGATHKMDDGKIRTCTKAGGGYGQWV